MAARVSPRRRSRREPLLEDPACVDDRTDLKAMLSAETSRTNSSLELSEDSTHRTQACADGFGPTFDALILARSPSGTMRRLTLLAGSTQSDWARTRPPVVPKRPAARPDAHRLGPQSTGSCVPIAAANERISAFDVDSPDNGRRASRRPSTWSAERASGHRQSHQK